MPTSEAHDLRRVLICKATGIFARDYLIALENGLEASVKFSMFSRAAKITIAGETYEVLDEYSTKDSSFIGWNLMRRDEIVASAKSPDCLFFPRFKIIENQFSFEFASVGFFTHSYELRFDSKVVGILKSTYVRPLTRKMSIECAPIIPLHLQLFSLTLAIFSWYRGSRSWL